MGDEEQPVVRTWEGDWPKSIKYLIWNEFCERFSYYGLKTILALFLLDHLHLSETYSTELVHFFIVLCYATPLMGAVLSDGFVFLMKDNSCARPYNPPFHIRETMALIDNLIPGLPAEEDPYYPGATVVLWTVIGAEWKSQFIKLCQSGKFRVILYLSIVYCIGEWVLTSSAIPDTSSGYNPSAFWLMALGLVLIAVGTGGIKPCVAAFGGDQIECTVPDGPIKDRLQRNFFSMYYFAVNAGAVISTLLTPWLREDYSYTVAFVLPATLMMVAVAIFFAGKRHFVDRPPEGNIFGEVGGIVIEAMKSQFSKKQGSPEQRALLDNQVPDTANNTSDKTQHWLDTVKEKHGSDRVEDIKGLIQVVIVLLPAPLFWSLSDQQSSKWIFQASDLDRHLPWWLGGFEMQPDQMQALNPVLVLGMIPLFDQVIYPFFENRRISLKPIRRMVMGIVLSAVAFVMSGLLQIAMDSTSYPGQGSSSVTSSSSISILWQVPQYVTVTAGEILFSITGLEFAYSQAPASMKSIVQSVWLFTVAGGNVVTIIIVAAIGESLSKAQEYFFFAVAAMVAVFAMMWLSVGFVYKHQGNGVEAPHPHNDTPEIASTMI